MFYWYKEAQVCYAYLSDVLSYPSFSELSLGEDESAFDECNSSFRSSNWFTRGWTLQELLAPGKLVFFDSQWRRIGRRDDTLDMWELVSEITGIERQWRGSSVAQKMSWASKRETTRIKDRAYSLMGLFGVHMPPLYGEWEKAFMRLQLEILRISDDESIFAWRDPNDLSGGLLALSPNAFQLSHGTSRLSRNDQQQYWMTNKRLSMERQLLRPAAYSIDSDDTFILPLQCGPGTVIPYVIVLKCVNSDQFARVSSGEFLPLLPGLLGDKMQSEVKRTVYIRQTDDGFGFTLRNLPTGYKFVLPTMPLLSKVFVVTNQYSSGTNRWEDIGGLRSTRQLLPLGGRGGTGAIEFRRLSGVGLTPPKPPERILVIFNVYYNHSRMLVLIPESGLSIGRIIANLLEHGEWTSKGYHHYHLFRPLKLNDGQEINYKLEKKGRVYDFQV
jgi:hypothetical protein